MFVLPVCRSSRRWDMEASSDKYEELEVIPMIENKPVANAELIGDALSVISLKHLSDDSDPDRVVKRNSYRNLHRPNISHLDWVSQSTSKDEVGRQRLCYTK